MEKDLCFVLRFVFFRVVWRHISRIRLTSCSVLSMIFPYRKICTTAYSFLNENRAELDFDGFDVDIFFLFFHNATTAHNNYQADNNYNRRIYRSYCCFIPNI